MYACVTAGGTGTGHWLGGRTVEVGGSTVLSVTYRPDRVLGRTSTPA